MYFLHVKFAFYILFFILPLYRNVAKKQSIKTYPNNIVVYAKRAHREKSRRSQMIQNNLDIYRTVVSRIDKKLRYIWN